MHDPDQRELAEDLSEILIEANVLSLMVRKELVGLLRTAKTSPTDLRVAVEHIQRSTHQTSVAPGQLVNLIREDPQLRATLKAARKWEALSEGPGARDRRENMELREQNPAGIKQRRAMYVYCAIEHKEVSNLEAIAEKLQVSYDEAAELLELGRRVYAGEEVTDG